MKPRQSPLRSSGKPGRKPRKASNYRRIYGSKARVEAVKLMPCGACGVEGFSENAHVVKGEKGMGYKAGYKCIAPLCGNHPNGRLGLLIPGCHLMFDEHRWAFDKLFPDFDPITAAAATEAAWQATLTREIL
jgi:hypothetical protein